MKQFLAAAIVGSFLAALAAQQPVDVSVPSGTMLYFDLAACPTGWTEYTTARGFYIVGLVSGGTKATAVGSALTDLENRTHTHTFPHTHTMAHTHTVAGTTSAQVGGQPAETTSSTVTVSDDHTHTFSVASGASSAANTGSESTANTGTQSTTIAPFLAYPLCSKT